MQIILFDFDGTITKSDSMFNFIKYSVGIKTYYYGLFCLSKILLKYKLKIIPNDKAKEKMITYFFKNWESDFFQKIADKYAIEKIDNIVRPKAIKKIKWHQEQGHKIVIVSASMENWLKKWCDNHNIDLIATRLEVQDGKLTGKFATKNCYGIEKINRIKERYDLSKYDYIYAYGDSSGDKEMLNLAHKSYYKPFR